MKKIVKISLCFALVLGIIIYWAFFQRETTHVTEHLELHTGDELKVDRILSSKVYHGGHVFGWGGGDHRNSLSYTFEGIKYKHETPYIPIVLNYWNKSFYICYFDRETDFSKINYRLFKSESDGSFKEIVREEFPKEISIQNLWLDSEGESHLKKMDPEEYWFRHSLTARLWYHLEEGVPYFSNKDPSREFVRVYKEKYIKKGLTSE